MTRRRALVLVTAAALIALAGTAAPADERAAFVIIVHPENRAASVDAAFLRDAYLKKASRWRDGTTVRPIDLAARFPAREGFARQVLRKTPGQLRAYWHQQIFSGKGVPPPEAATIEAAIAYVLANPGAVGYLPAGTSPGEAKVVGLQ